jgi:hypothetical protein
MIKQGSSSSSACDLRDQKSTIEESPKLVVHVDD